MFINEISILFYLRVSLRVRATLRVFVPK